MMPGGLYGTIAVVIGLVESGCALDPKALSHRPLFARWIALRPLGSGGLAFEALGQLEHARLVLAII